MTPLAAAIALVAWVALVAALGCLLRRAVGRIEEGP